jgi:NAD(P)-dependent dehydrogenase (short-subunit alcohol dehydrogenase family)
LQTAALAGRRCVVTGATNGIGRATAESLANRGATVVVHGRNRLAVETVCRMIAERTRNSDVTGAVADFSSLEDVRRMAGELRSRYDRLDVLVNNAGTVTTRRRTTADGYEWQFGVNHLAAFLLTESLLPALERSASGRIVTVSSRAHLRATIDLDDLNWERRKYHGMRAYGASKLANVLFTFELARRLDGTKVTANCLHPGVVATNIFKEPRVVAWIMKIVGRWLLLSPEDGAATSVYLASSPEVASANGKYFDECREAAVNPIAHDAVLARRLWEVSERLTGLG